MTAESIPRDYREWIAENFPGTPAEPCLGHLTDVFRLWCRLVPFDNSLRWLELHGGRFAWEDGVTPGGTSPGEFWAAYRRHGCGGTCVSTTLGLGSLLKMYGYRFRYVMARLDDEDRPNHLVTAVTLPDGTHVLDTLAMNEQPVPLESKPVSTGSGLYQVTSAPIDGGWETTRATAVRRSIQRCVLNLRELLGDARTFYRTSQSSESVRRFNNGLHARINSADGGTVVVMSRLAVRVSATGQQQWTRNAGEVLREDFGWSSELVRRLELSGAI